MSQTFANRDYIGHSSRDRQAAARADHILARAERREAVFDPATRVELSQLDKLAFAVIVIMTLGPLFAAAVGAMIH